MKTRDNNEHIYFCKIANSIISALYNANLPIVFKGMAVNRLILIDNNASFIRETRDIDGDWIGEPLSTKEIENKINSALVHLDGITVISYRKYDEHISAGFDILQNNIKIGSFDLSIRKNKFYKLYDIEGIKFYGQTLEKTITDKICVLSSHKIFRRSKDMLDLYSMSKFVDIQIEDIIDIANESNREIGNFSPLYNQKEELRHAYESMYWLENKPLFDDVYKCCIEIANKFTKKP